MVKKLKNAITATAAIKRVKEFIPWVGKRFRNRRKEKRHRQLVIAPPPSILPGFPFKSGIILFPHHKPMIPMGIFIRKI